ncbi:MAG: hypothetical protein CMH30_00185 [Micavibrio sp.]|nr:hypothetical protein [Micavibrio sp.]|tara:strand:+ start:3862 stop:4203 length:342 start_codon:yes stop_codon:yes gene_type:complete
MKVKLYWHIFRNFEEIELGCWAEKQIKLPIAPIIGMYIYDKSGQRFVVNKISYDLSSKIVSCTVDVLSEDPHFFTIDYESKKNMAIEDGWKVRETSGEVSKIWKFIYGYKDME